MCHVTMHDQEGLQPFRDDARVRGIASETRTCTAVMAVAEDPSYRKAPVWFSARIISLSLVIVQRNACISLLGGI